MKDPEVDWVNGTPPPAVVARGEWVEALKAADAGDVKPLTALLRSPGHRPSQVERIYIADLLSRHTLRKKRGHQATPAYRETKDEAKLVKGAAQYRYYRARKHKSAVTLQMAWRETKREELYLAGDIAHVALTDVEIDELFDRDMEGEIERLASLVKGRRGTARRKEQRRKPIK